MKSNLLTTLFFSFLFINISFAQHKKSHAPSEDVIDINNVYIQYKNNKPHDFSITNHNIQQLFGKPLKVKSGKSEVTDLMYKEYTYPFGVMFIEDGNLTDIEFKRPGLGYIFKNKKSFTKPIFVGSDCSYLKEIFPNSWTMISNNQLIVWIKNCDCNISFEISKGKIKSMMFFTNES
jgi:hypothetical protein